jgi:hypothetical protein
MIIFVCSSSKSVLEKLTRNMQEAVDKVVNDKVVLPKDKVVLPNDTKEAHEDFFIAVATLPGVSSVFPVKSQKCDFGAEPRWRLFATSAGKGLIIM